MRGRRPSALLAVAFLAIASIAAAAAGSGSIFSDHRPSRAGETCLVCGRPVGPDDTDYRIRGRWVSVHAGPCDDGFRAHPGTAFASLQPRGALFQEEFDDAPGLGWGWFLAGVWILSALASAAACAHLAWERRLPPFRWFALGLAFGLFAVAYVVTTFRRVEPMPPRLGRLHDMADPILCEICGTGNHPSARRCTGCGATLSPRSEAEVGRALHGRA